MELPTYYKIIVDESSFDEFDQFLFHSPIGKRPCYVDLLGRNSEEVIPILNQMNERLVFLEISYQFPYPVYILNENVRNHPNFRMVKDVSELPKFFNLKSKRPRNNDMELLRKINIQRERINNLNLDAKLGFIRGNAHLNKKLYLLSL